MGLSRKTKRAQKQSERRKKINDQNVTPIEKIHDQNVVPTKNKISEQVGKECVSRNYQNLSPESKKKALELKQKRESERYKNLTPTSKNRILEVKRDRENERYKNLVPTSKKIAVDIKRKRANKRYANLTPTSKKIALDIKRKRENKRYANLTPTSKKDATEVKRKHTNECYKNLTPTSKARKIQTSKIYAKKRVIFRKNIEPQNSDFIHGYYMKKEKIEEFEEKIKECAEYMCEICQKMYFRYQVSRATNDSFCASFQSYLPHGEFFCCNRCKSTMRKNKIPSNAFWNNMLVSKIPKELEQLSEMEIRLLSRVRPFIRMFKLPGKFGQLGFKGQAVLFPQQVEEIANQLPLTADQLGIVIVSETLELRNNINRCKEFSVNIEHLKSALIWLKKHNQLYHSVQVEISDDVQDICSRIFITQSENETISMPANIGNSIDANVVGNDVIRPAVENHFKTLVGNREILHGTFHQASVIIPDANIRGKQCTAIAATAIIMGQEVRSFTNWCTNDIDRVLLLGSTYYTKCLGELYPRIPPNGYLMASELSTTLQIGNKEYHLSIEADLIAGVTSRGTVDVPGIYRTLSSGLTAFFTTHTFGILTIENISVAICMQSNKWWLFDSHSRGEKGRVAANGKAMLMNFVNIESLSNHICIITNSKNEAHNFSIAAIRTVPHSQSTGMNFSQESNENMIGVVHDNEDSPQIVNEIETTAIMPIDIQAPVVEDVIVDGQYSEEGVPIHDLIRKTTTPLSALRERRAEELAWYFLYPDGKNGFGESRSIPITPLDYYQTRVMSFDKRFQRTDYLFYALSMVELWKATKNVSVCGRLIQDGVQVKSLVNKLHISMRNIRGTGAYWQDALSHLLAMVSMLGPPTWFITLSCNDLNWKDILRALLKADGRPDTPLESVSFDEQKRLVEQYPVVVARQFMHRFNAILKLMRNDKNILHFRIIDFWWRMEVQLRGSPHIHFVVWCENVPSFDTEEGKELINKVISCSTNTGDVELDEIVKKVQIHRHTQTCFKKDNATNCRFGFPRKACEETKVMSPDEALRNGGRFCILKRDSDDTMVNNYNPFILKAWNGNMDIQPCGSAVGVSYYIAKYVAKSEPSVIQESVRKAIQTVNEYNSEESAAKKLFAGSMAILNRRQVSAIECAFRLCHLQLRGSSRKCVFVNNCLPQERYRMLRIGSDDTYNNIFDKYINRPDNLERLCLGEFATNYESTLRSIEEKNCDDPDDNDDDDDDDKEVEEQVDTHDESTKKKPKRAKYITLLNSLGRMKVRTRPAVLRTRHFTPDSDPERYYYGLLVIHLPFRREASLTENFPSSKDAFFAKRDQLQSVSKEMNLSEVQKLEVEIQNAIQRIVAERAIEDLNRPENQGENIAAEELLNIDNDLVVIGSTNVSENDLDEIAGQHRMSDEYFQGCMQSLNVAQKELVKKISHHLVNSSEEAEQLLMFITGGAGSGKSYTLKLIIELIRRFRPTDGGGRHIEYQGKNPVMIAAPTGVAAKLVGGKTLHSAFLLPVEKVGEILRFTNLTGRCLEMKRLEWKYIDWVVIDEISMVSYRVLRMIHLRLQQLKQNDKPFGGVHMLLFGDLMQLPPVRATHCFQQPNEFQAELHLWRLFSFSELTTIMRQQNDTEFVDILNNLRVGSLTVNQLTILNNRRLDLVNDNGEFDDGKVIRVFPTTKQVTNYNEKMCTELEKNNIRLYNINSEDRSLEPATSGLLITDSKKLPKDPNKTGGFLPNIKIGIGSRVMLRRNINISKGLVNGSMGVIQRLEWSALRLEQMEDGDLPKHIIIKFDDLDEETLIEPCTVVFQGLRGCGKIERKMLPIILCWAVTVHKLQGVTLERAVIDLGRKIFSKGQAYVALSRVKTLSGVAISELWPARLLDNPHDEYSLNELRRMRQLPSTIL